MEDVLRIYRDKISDTHEELAKELAIIQKKPFTLPLTAVQLMILQEFVDVVFPDLITKIGQIDDADPPYFSLTTSPGLIVDIQWWERTFSHFFVRPVYLHGSPLGWANRRVYFFRMSTLRRSNMRSS